MKPALKDQSFVEQKPQFADLPPPKTKKIIEDDGSPYIELITGGRFYFNKPTWDIGAIAHSLSLQCRFTGQCRKFYSVAEHSVLVSRVMEQVGLGDPMEGLLHDAVESVLADVARPAKQLLKDYKALDSALDKSMRASFSLPEEMTEGCRIADGVALVLEAAELMPSKGVGPAWEVATATKTNLELRTLAKNLTFQVNGWTSENSKERFMQRMTDIRRRMKGLR